MQRNGQNPIRKISEFAHGENNPAVTPKHAKLGGSAGICPNCKTEVPAKPGFRFSSLKCPKCGSSMGKK